MLDEIKEVEAYLCNPDAKSPRIIPQLLFEKGGYRLNGLMDVLTLISCHYIYNFCECKDINKGLKEKVFLILRIWCGFEDDVTEEELDKTKAENKKWFDTYPEAEGWLCKYYHTHRTKGWNGYSNKRAEQLKQSLVYTGETLCYEKVLAQAIARGPLKTNYLVMKNDYMNAVKNDIKNGKGETPLSKKQGNILKIIAAYKTLQTLHPGQKYVLLQTNRVLGWMGISSDKDTRWCLDYTWRGEPLFLKAGSKDFKKFYVNEAFLEVVDAKIMDDVSDVSTEEYLIYRDEGHQNKLVKL